MKRSEPFSDRTLMPVQGEHGIDDLLREYFRAELPQRWPAPPSTRSEPKSRLILMLFPTPRQMHRARRYLALAATVALFVLGYWTLAAAFPNLMPGPAYLQSHYDISHKDRAPDYDPSGVDDKQPNVQNNPDIDMTRSGEPVRVLERKSGNKLNITVIPVLPQP
jgi:hypothetical protein